MSYKQSRSPSCLVVALLLVVSFLTAVPALQADELIQIIPEGSEKPVPAVADELIVKYKDDVSFAEKREFRDENDLTKESIKRDPLVREDIETVQLENAVTSKELNQIIDRLEDNPNVEYVEPNWVMGIQTDPSATPPPNPPYPPYQGGQKTPSPLGMTNANDTDFGKQWALSKINLPQAWEAGRGDAKTVIAVLDTGLDFSHPDRPLNLKPGYDFVNDDTDPQDDHGHGTFIAGIIAANTNNSLGVAGLCPGCSIMPVKVMDSHGAGTYADVAKGIVWAADHGANIINLSIGGYAYSQALLDAVSYAQEKGALIIAAGGNQGVSDPLYPAAYENVLGISATDENDQRWARSNYGDSIDLAAPGVNIRGLSLNGTYKGQTGTSGAAAHVAGTAGLLLSRHPSDNSAQLTDELTQNTQDLGAPGKDSLFGNGRLWMKLEEKTAEPEVKPEIKPVIEVPVVPEAKADEGEVGNDTGATQPPQELSDEIILIGQRRWNYSVARMQSVLDKQPGRLKDYKRTFSDGSQASAAELITTANALVMMELLSGVVTNPNATDKEIGGYSMRVDEDRYWAFETENLKGHYQSEERLQNAIKLFKSYGPFDESLDNQVSYVADNFGKEFNCFAEYYDSSPDCPSSYIVFKDGSTLPVSPNINAETFAIQRVLASLTNDKEEWRRWVSRGPGSFYDLYKQWFGDPVKPIQIMTPQTSQEEDSAFFLRKPYNGFVNVNSFYDHNLPNYSIGGLDGRINIFVGGEREGANESTCQLGYSCYDDHDGIDYSTFQNAIYAPGNGKVFKLKSQNIKPKAYGNVVYLQHDADNDGVYDYISIYAHLQDKEFKNGLSEDPESPENIVTAGQQIGWSGGTGGYDPHLHFGVRKIKHVVNPDGSDYVDPIPENHPLLDPYGWWGAQTEPSAGREDVGGDYTSTASHWLWGSKEAKLTVDDEDVSFQQFVNKDAKDKDGKLAPAIWREAYDSDEKNRALYTYAANDKNEYNWAFWVPNLAEDGEYKVFAHVPNYSVKNKTVATKVHYFVYDKNGVEAVPAVDQSAYAAKDKDDDRWIPLGTYTFEKGSKSAVRIVDSVDDKAEAGKIIWADAIRWEKQEKGILDKLNDILKTIEDRLASLRMLFTDTFKVVKTRTDKWFSYEIPVTLKNTGPGPDTGSMFVCLSGVTMKPQTQSSDNTPTCYGSQTIGNMAPGTTKNIKLSFKTPYDFAPGSTFGTLEIRKTVNGPAISSQDISWSQVEDDGGVDLTSAALTGISIDPNGGGIRFVIKGDKAEPGDKVIDLNGARSDMQKIFLQALAIPDYKHYISLDINENGGKARIEEPFQNTDMEIILLD